MKAKLAPERVRLTLAFAGIYQMAHEMIKRTVVEDVKNFYGHSPLDNGTWLWGEQRQEVYKRDMLALKSGRPFLASLRWLQASEAITAAQVARLEEI